MSRHVFCAWCGQDLGESASCFNEIESCGERECDREVRKMVAEAREQAMLDAAADDYGRYR